MESPASNPFERVLAAYRLPILAGVGVILAFAAFHFVSGMVLRNRDEKAWTAFLEAGQGEDRDLAKVGAALGGTSAEPWYWLAAAADAIAKDDFEGSRAHLERLRRSEASGVRSLGKLLDPEAATQELSVSVMNRIDKFLEWKKANGRLFANPAPETKPRIVLVTDEGDIGIGLYRQQAPKATENFTKLCKEGFYDGTKVFEVLVGLSLRAGDPSTRAEDPSAWANQGPGYTLELDEEKNALAGFKGSLVAYRNPGETAYSGSQFQILLSNQLGLDPYVFGQVVDGMDVVERLGKITSEFKSGKSIPSRIVTIKTTRVEE